MGHAFGMKRRIHVSVIKNMCDHLSGHNYDTIMSLKINYSVDLI